MIVASELTKAYRQKRVLRGLSFTARPGEITLLIGANGAGKSTTMKVLTGLAAVDGGTAQIAEKDIKCDKLAAQRMLSFLPQTPNFHPRFTCAQIIDFYARLRGLDAPRREFALDIAGLREVVHQPTRTLSGGMRQRLGMALLLLPDAPVLLLDEPGISLDPAWRRRLQNILHEEAGRGKTILVTTHLIGEWNNVADRCLVCREGVIEREIDPAHLTDNVADLDGESAGSLAAASGQTDGDSGSPKGTTTKGA